MIFRPFDLLFRSHIGLKINLPGRILSVDLKISDHVPGSQWDRNGYRGNGRFSGIRVPEWSIRMPIFRSGHDVALLWTLQESHRET